MAWVDFSQGLDIRLMTQEKIEMLMKMNIKQVRFAWDRYSDREYIMPRGHVLRDLQRWVCGRQIFRSCKKFEDYQP